MTTLPPDRRPPPIPEGLDQWNGSDSVNTVRAAWDRAEDHNAPADLLHLYQSTLAELIDQDRNPCPEDDPAAASGQYQPALNHILALLQVLLHFAGGIIHPVRLYRRSSPPAKCNRTPTRPMPPPRAWRFCCICWVVRR